MNARKVHETKKPVPHRLHVNTLERILIVLMLLVPWTISIVIPTVVGFILAHPGQFEEMSWTAIIIWNAIALVLFTGATWSIWCVAFRPPVMLVIASEERTYTFSIDPDSPPTKH